MGEKEKENNLVTQAQLAAEHKVSRKSVTVWKRKGYVVFLGKKIDRNKTNRKLENSLIGKYRKPVVTPLEGNTVTPPDAEVTAFWGDASEWRGLTQAEADRRKAISLAYNRHLDNQAKEGTLVDTAVAEKEAFSTARAMRDAWVGWPARVGAIMGAEMGIEAAVLTSMLEKFVRDELASQSSQHLYDAGKGGDS